MGWPMGTRRRKQRMKAVSGIDTMKHPVSATCPSCNGTGFVTSETRAFASLCPACGGSCYNAVQVQGEHDPRFTLCGASSSCQCSLPKVCADPTCGCPLPKVCLDGHHFSQLMR